MEGIQVRLSWAGSEHTFALPADVALAYMGQQGIQVEGTAEGRRRAMEEIAASIVRPIISVGVTRLAEERTAEIMASVKGE